MAALCRICGADFLGVRRWASLPWMGCFLRPSLLLFLCSFWLLQATELRAAAPSITSQPQSRTVVEGNNHTFSVTASGTAPLSYQWRRDNAELPGKTASSLALTGIQTNDGGFYTVVITNVSGAITSAPARLTVRLASDPLYPTPQGGWAYLFPGNAAAGN